MALRDVISRIFVQGSILLINNCKAKLRTDFTAMIAAIKMQLQSWIRRVDQGN